jgi:hypothetical protein
MVILDVLYVALATIAVMFILQILTFLITRMMYPPEPKIIYRDAPPQMMAPLPQMQSQIYIPPQPQPQMVQVLTQQPPKEEIKLPDYEPRSQPASGSLRLDSELPAGLKETRPEGT